MDAAVRRAVHASTQRRWSFLAVGFVVFLLCGCSAPQHQMGPSPTLEIRMFNYTQVTHNVTVKVWFTGATTSMNLSVAVGCPANNGHSIFRTESPIGAGELSVAVAEPSGATRQHTWHVEAGEPYAKKYISFEEKGIEFFEATGDPL